MARYVPGLVQSTTKVDFLAVLGAILGVSVGELAT